MGNGQQYFNLFVFYSVTYSSALPQQNSKSKGAGVAFISCLLLCSYISLSEKSSWAQPPVLQSLCTTPQAMQPKEHEPHRGPSAQQLHQPKAQQDLLPSTLLAPKPTQPRRGTVRAPPASLLQLSCFTAMENETPSKKLSENKHTVSKVGGGFFPCNSFTTLVSPFKGARLLAHPISGYRSG